MSSETAGWVVLTAEERKKLEKLKKRRQHVKSPAVKQGMQHNRGNEVSDVISTFVSFYFISGAMTMPDSRGRQAKLAFYKG